MSPWRPLEAILHHAARTRSERRHTFRLLRFGGGLLLWLFSRAAIMRMRRVAAFTRLDRVLGALSRDRGVAATEKTAAGHPDREADRQKQSHHFVREEQIHLYGSLLSAPLFVEISN